MGKYSGQLWLKKNSDQFLTKENYQLISFDAIMLLYCPSTPTPQSSFPYLPIKLFNYNLLSNEKEINIT